MNKNDNIKSDIEIHNSIQTNNVTEDNQKETLNPNDKDAKESETKADIDNEINVKDISSLIPNGWHILEKHDGKLAKVEGDLNKDGIADLAIVIEGNAQKERPLGPPRALLIAFGNRDESYSLSIKADKAIMLGDEGGGFGDPFEDISIDRGSILLKFFGGSSSRWYKYYRFQYQKNGWYLIGATEGSLVPIGNTMDNIEEDYNLLTGDYIFRKLVDDKIETIQGNRGKRQLLNLNDFIVSSDIKTQF